MNNFLETIMKNDHVVLNVSICSIDDCVSLISYRFNLHDIYIDTDANQIMLTQEDGTSLTLPSQNWTYSDEEGEEGWGLTYNDIVVFIYIEEIN